MEITGMLTDPVSGASVPVVIYRAYGLLLVRAKRGALPHRIERLAPRRIGRPELVFTFTSDASGKAHAVVVSD